MIVEIVAVRVLSPHFGNTIYTVSSVISVILAALSIGYYAGGKLADRKPSLRWFFGIILICGLLLIVFHFFGRIILPIVSTSLSLATGPLISSLLLFFIPSLLLGTLSPYAVKLQSDRSPEMGIGSIAGKIFFWSTLGSIAGSLLAGFVLIPKFGIDTIFLSTAFALFILGFIPLVISGYNKKLLLQSLLALIILSILSIFFIRIADFAVNLAGGNVVYSKDGVYEKISIYDGELDGRKIRFFHQDKSESGAMFLDTDDPTDLVYEYTKYYSIYKVFKPDVQNALVIGGGAYSIPKALLADFPQAEVDVAEIEPLLLDLAQRYFEVKKNSKIHNFTEDGRRLLRTSEKKYDLIFSDVYYSLFSIPAHFTTKEFFSLAKEGLSQDGVFMANLIGDLSRQKPSLIMSEIKTFQSVFENSYFFATESPGLTDAQNIIFVGYNSEKKIDFSSDAVARNDDARIRLLKDKLIVTERFDLSSYPVLTDNYSPVEYLTSKTLKRTFEEKPLIDGNEMMAIIEQQLGYGPRFLTAPGHKKVQKFLLAEMKEHADTVETQEWTHVGKDQTKYQLTNIISRMFPIREKRIILATHYDSKKFADKDAGKKDSPVPGANDSASGVALLIELARVFKNSEEKPDVGVDIIFFDGEEGEEDQGSDYSSWEPIGSTYFAKNLDLFYESKKPLSALVVDMVCDKDLRILKEPSSVKSAPKEVEEFWKVGKKVDSRVFQDKTSVTILDDHTPLNKAGIPSFLVIDYDFPFHHTTKDTLDTCSAKSLQAVALAVLKYVYSIE